MHHVPQNTYHKDLISAIVYGNENIPPNMNFGERIQHFGGHIRN